MKIRKILVILTIFSLNIFTFNSYVNASFLDEVQTETAKAVWESVWNFLSDILNTEVWWLIDYNVSEWKNAYEDLINSLIDKSYSNYSKSDFNKDFWDIFNNLLNKQIKSLETGYTTLKNTYISSYNKNIVIWNVNPILDFHKQFCTQLIEQDDLIVNKKIFNVKVKFNEIKFSSSWFKDTDTLNAFRDNILKYETYLKRRDAVCSDDYHNNLVNLSNVISYINTYKNDFYAKYWKNNINKIINNYIIQNIVR